MSKPTYYELLRDPRWQKKRLVIMSRANFKCELCGAADKTLNVHHSYYERGNNPWEYPDESLYCLCEPCHKDTQGRMDEVKRLIGKLRIDDWSMDSFIGYLKCKVAEERDETHIKINSMAMAVGVATYFCGMSGSDVRGMVDPDGSVKVELLKAVAYMPFGYEAQLTDEERKRVEEIISDNARPAPAEEVRDA